jgi:lysophospholipase L1-like esterase
MSNFPLNTMFAGATFAAILLGVHLVDPRHGMDPASWRGAVEFHFDRASFFPVVAEPQPGVADALAVPNPDAPGWTPATAASLTLTSEYLADRAGVLDHFYAALKSSVNAELGRPVRIVHYGDSPTTADLITGDARELLQERFGDAGAGFVLIAKPWAWYGHHGVDVSAKGWKIDTAVGSMREGAYGLGGAIFTGPVGATSTIHLDARESPTSIEVLYLAQPEGGAVEVSADGVSVGSVNTEASDAAKKNGAVTIALPEGTREVQLRVAGAPVQVFGVAFGHGQSGLTYDSIGLNGASTTVMSRAFSPENWGDALAHRNPDLVIINYGTNEASFPGYVDKQYEGELRRAIGRVRTALPEASILVMSPMDRGAKGDGEDITTMPAIPKLVAIQRRVAQDMGCGFFDTFDAMGGDGTMAKWYTGHPRMVAADLIHPTPQGARIVAQELTAQLLIGYQRYLQRHGPHGNAIAKASSTSTPKRGVDLASDRVESMAPKERAASSAEFVVTAESAKSRPGTAEGVR